MASLTLSLLPGLSATVKNNTTLTGQGSNVVVAGNGDNINLTGGNNTVTAYDNDAITISGGNNWVSLHNYDTLTINDARTIGNGYSGNIAFSDTVTAKDYNAISLNYSLALGNSDVVSVNFNPQLTLGIGNTIISAFTVNAGNSDVITFSGSGNAITLNAAGGDTVMTTGANDTITIGNSANFDSSASTGGACSRGIVLTVGATAAGTTFNGGLGTDTFTAGAGYDGGNNFIGSIGSQAQLFNAGNCINYSGLSCTVNVNLNSGIGQAFDANNNLLWTDTYTDIEQAKAGKANGNVLTGSDSFFSELKGGLGQATYNGGAGGDRIIWGEAGATGLVDGQGTDVANLGSGYDELYWRNQPSNSKGVSNFGETAYHFNIAQGDALNFTEMATAGFAGVSHSFGGANDLANWVNVSLNGNDTNVYFDKSGSGNFTQTAAVTLKGDNLFADFGVADTSNTGAQQVVQDLYNTGHLIFNATH